LLVAACGRDDGAIANLEPSSDDATEVPLAEGEFETAHPAGNAGSPTANDFAGHDAIAAENSTDTVAPPQAPGPGALAGAAQDQVEREIEEADIIKVDGDTLYALSQFGGLSVIDLADPNAISLLGRFKVTATPFEMYIRDGVAIVLYNGYGEYTYDEDAALWNWYQTSYVVAIDARSTSDIAELGRFHVPGTIADSRIVGDSLYVAAFENGNCWQCGSDPRTHLLSLDVSDPTAIEQVDELSFEERENGYSWQRSVSATNERLYVAGPTWGGDEPVGSTIQVVDISDASGNMALGDSLEVDGQIQSRWQMDEYDGVLRVISQPMTWRAGDPPPRIETFTIESSDQLTPLGSVAMQIPRNETLRSVRFDGERAYAITAEQMDPLFTIDLSAPENPRQVGELEMPGWVYHMEPRGDRVLGLGYDQGNAEGAITVSLFDVSDMANPTMIERVNFGGDWSSLPEDQDRIHKAFNVLESEGLLLIPFSGWVYGQQAGEGDSDEKVEECESSRHVSGVQLVDWQDDTLLLRGVAPVYGQARRGFIHEQRLLTMSDDRVESFDIGNRDEPEALDTVSLALRANHAATQGGVVTRVGNDWYTNTTELTVSSLAQADNPDAGFTLQLPEIEGHGCYGGSWLNEVIASEDRVYLLWQQYSYDPNTGDNDESSRILTVDVSALDAPQVIGDAAIDFVPGYYGYGGGMVASGQPILESGSTLIFGERRVEQENPEQSERFLRVLDMSEPAAPSLKTVTLPSSGGSTNLLSGGDIVATSHFTQSPTNPERVRFYLDRVDISDSSEPILMAPVNIPGSLLAYDSQSEHALTVSYATLSEDATERDCYEQLGGQFQYPGEDYQNYDWETTVGTCQIMLHTLNLVAIEDDKARLLDSHAFEQGQLIGATSLGDDRLFVSLNNNGYGGTSIGGPPIAAVDIAIGPGFGGIYYGYNSFERGTAPLLVFGGIRSDELEMGSIELETGDSYYGRFDHLVASGQRVVVAAGFRGKLTVVDAADVSDPNVVRQAEVLGWIEDLDVDSGIAVAAMGYDGIQTIRIDD
jgi:hypothetical protein